MIILIELEIIPFDPVKATETEWKKYHTYRKIRHDESQPNFPIVSDASYEETLKQTPQRLSIQRFNVFERSNLETQIGEIYFSFYKYGEDEDVAIVNSGVLSSHRHKGIGAQLLKKLADLALENKKSRIIFKSAENEGIKVIELFKGHKISEQEQFRLTLSETNWNIVNTWLDQTKELKDKVTMEWVNVVDSIPTEILEQYTRIFSSVFDEFPKYHVASSRGSKDMPLGALKYDIKQFNAKGGKWMLGLIREKNGDVSGLTELKWSPSRPEFLMQFITHIKLQYRSTGKGKLLKGKTMEYIKKNFPDIKYLQTGFVGDKTSALYQMNEKLGFKLFYHNASYEIPTADLEKWASEHEKKN